jgi:subtilisin family serine protease
MAARTHQKTVNEGKSIRDMLAKSTVSLELRAAMEAKQEERKRFPRRRSKKNPVDALLTVAEPSMAEPDRFDVIVEFNRNVPGGVLAARTMFLVAYRKACERGDRPLASEELALTNASAVSSPSVTIDDTKLVDAFGESDRLKIRKSMWTDSYVFGLLSSDAIARISSFTVSPSAPISQTDDETQRVAMPIPLIYKIWHDQKIKRCVYESRRTVKGDAALSTFSTDGRGIVWAVADTGVDGSHPHFQTLDTLMLPDGLTHMDFTDSGPQEGPLIDNDGHGTHVAGIIAGMTCRAGDMPPLPVSEKTRRKIAELGVKWIKIAIDTLGDDNRRVPDARYREEPIYGIAPYCKILSLKVLRGHDDGDLSSLISALTYVRRANDYGRSLKIHGVNLSVGYDFNAEWFAAGQSPLCNEVDLLARSGVCVVVAAGNGGYGAVTNDRGGNVQATHLGTISDPGNAALAITVGSTHRDMPHSYGVSYFSAKGPTADGRMKPDLVAPGERIVSCDRFVPTESNVAPYKVDSGTSMAAPHVSGALAAFMSARNEFIGRPEDLKAIFVKAATDLGRRPEFQGGGLLDLMRALQSV